VAYYLRIIKARDFSDSSTWLSPDSVPEHAVRHFRSDEDELSLFSFGRIEDVGRIVAAFATVDRERIKSRDVIYCLTECLDLEDMLLTSTDGDLFDGEVSGWHRTLSGLTEAKSRLLAFQFGARGCCRSFSRAEVCELIANAVARGFIRESTLSGGVAKDLRKYRQAAGH
jgi:hypothetical protein